MFPAIQLNSLPVADGLATLTCINSSGVIGLANLSCFCVGGMLSQLLALPCIHQHLQQPVNSVKAGQAWQPGHPIDFPLDPPKSLLGEQMGKRDPPANGVRV